jgi:hypothetical protein
VNNFNNIIHKIHKILINDPPLAKDYYLKWGIDLKDFENKINDPLIHGGYISKMISVNNLDCPKDIVILDIGPEMGLEVFMLAEFAKRIVVCDPDKENLDLIGMLVKKYRNNECNLISDFIEFKPYGINNNEIFAITENKRYESIVNKLGHSLPTFYRVTSTEDIDKLENDKFDLIFIHKILTTITRSAEKNQDDIFFNAVRKLIIFLQKGGICSWTEPEFVFQQKGVIENINKLDDINYSIISYQPAELAETFMQFKIIGK